MNNEKLAEIMNDCVREMGDLRKALQQANRAIRMLRGRVKKLDAEFFNEPRAHDVEAFCRNYERIDNLRQAIRLALHNIRRLESIGADQS